MIVPEFDFELKEQVLASTKPRFIHSHMPYTPDYPKVIYLMRDGRDVAVSYFYYLKKLGEIDDDKSFSQFLPNFVKNGVNAYGRWPDHVENWLKRTNENSLLSIKYEDLLKDTKAEFVKILQFSGVEIDQDLVNRAVNASTFSLMQNLEIAQHDLCPTLKDIKNKKIRFVREGRSGHWSTVFSKQDEEIFLQASKKTLELLGFL